MMRALEPKPLLHCNAFSRFATAICTLREIEYFPRPTWPEQAA